MTASCYGSEQRLYQKQYRATASTVSTVIACEHLLRGTIDQNKLKHVGAVAGSVPVWDQSSMTSRYGPNITPKIQPTTSPQVSLMTKPDTSGGTFTMTLASYGATVVRPAGG